MYTTSFFANVTYTVPVPPVGTLLPFRGNIHAHSSYSDGNQDGTLTTPLQDFQYAAASLHSDFLGISEHNHAQAGMSLPNYARGLQQADQATTAGFVALYGMEWGVISGGGHVVVYGVNQLLGWEPGNYDVLTPRNDYQALFREINRRPGAFATLAHPNRTDYGNLTGTAFSPRADSAIVGTVLRSGPATSTNTTYTNPSRGSYTPYFQTLLAKGYHADQVPASMSVGVSDADNEAVSSVQVLRGVPGNGAKPVVVAAAGATALSCVDPQAVNTTAYYYAVVAQADGDSIVTSPIWYTRRIITSTTPREQELALTVFPNPTAGGHLTTLSYYLKASTTVSADVLDGLGRPVRALALARVQGAGPHTLDVPTVGLAAGLYTVRLMHDGATAYRKLVVQ